jgi:hypothetical protein
MDICKRKFCDDAVRAGTTYICKHNNLEVNNPELVEEWHPRNNKHKTMDECASGSAEKVWWICPINPCGCHTWEAAIGSRALLGRGCPYCLNMKLCNHNNLFALHPELEIEWHPDNVKNMDEYAPSSGKIVKWKCQNDSCGCHEWNSSIVNRTNRGSGCPYCCGKKYCRHKNLRQEHPELIKEWHPDNKSMSSYLSGSHEKVKWICQRNPCGCHIWTAVIKNRAGLGNGCPYCSRHKFCKHNNLKIVYPELEKEWHSDNKSMSSYSCNSGEKVKWTCLKNKSHIWNAVIYNRAKKHQGCPKCLMCPSCMLWKTMGKLCQYCRPKSQNKLYQKTKEMSVVKFLKINLPEEEFIHNKSVGKDCTQGHLFPDILFNCSYYYIIVEVDEFKHRGVDYKCDKQRMYDIISKLGLPCIFIRYNPDHKKSDKSALLEMVEEYLAIQYDEEYFEEGLFPWNDFGYHCEYLYYH